MRTGFSRCNVYSFRFSCVAATALAADKKILIQASDRQSWVSSDAALAKYRAAAGTQADIVVVRSPAEFAREVADADAIIGGISKRGIPYGEEAEMGADHQRRRRGVLLLAGVCKE